MKQRRNSNRLHDYDYSQEGMYFVTICAQDRACLFGDIRDGEMVLNEYGQCALRCWQAIPDHFNDTDVDEIMIMPNHVHGIVVIGCRGTACRAPTKERFGKPVAGSLPTIIRSFKSAVTKQINAIRGTSGQPIWQRNYYEHVIRDERDLYRIRQYIITNPADWKNDENYRGS
jgi:REP element-mobilizing transposase RayT